MRKAGGIYYTPTYIVDYIVKNTVGMLVEKKIPKDLDKIRVLDPACGSGSFLLSAYQYLLNWHRDWYTNDGAEKWARGRKPTLYQAQGGDWHLTTAEKKRILLNNIYGVDIDPQAVEVTKLSLLLKVLEGESEQTLNNQFKMFHERALPDLSSNIKCGNSLIGPDFFEEQLILDEKEFLHINAFDWDAEFAEIMKAGGFDAVIGNPPWGADFSIKVQQYFRINYQSAKESGIDSYVAFIERSLTRLKTNGLLGYITPDTFLRKDNHLMIRKFLLENTQIVELIETGPLFSKVRDTWCLVSTISKRMPKATSRIKHKKISRFIVSTEERLEKFGKLAWDFESNVPQAIWRSKPKMIIGYSATVADQAIIDKMETQHVLGELSNAYMISRGEEGSKFALQGSQKGRFSIVIPKDIERYWVDEGLNIDEQKLTKNKVLSLYRHPKIWIVRIQKMRWQRRLVCGVDERTNSAGMKTLQIIISTSDSLNDLKYLQGILASRLINYWCVNYLADDMNQSYLEKIPIHLTNGSLNKALDNKMISLVDQMISLNKQFSSAKTDYEKTTLQRQIDTTDKQIDKFVYEIYGLTGDEIKVVEGNDST